MKKWLGESSASCLQRNRNTHEEQGIFSNSVPIINVSPKNDKKITKSDSKLLNMGLGASSEPESSTRDQTENYQLTNPTATSTSSEVPVSLCHGSVSFITSVSKRIQVASPCHHFSPETVSVHVHTPQPSTSTTSQEVPHMISLIASQKPSFSMSSKNDVQSKERNAFHYSTKKKSSMVQESSNSSIASSPDNHGLAISLPSNPGSTLCHVPCKSEDIQQTWIPLSSNESASLSVNGEIKPNSSKEDSITVGIRPEPDNQLGSASVCDYGTTVHSGTSKNTHIHSEENELVCSKKAAPSSSTCSHWCSMCRVRLQVEVECIHNSQRSPSGNRRGIRTLSFPKRVRHKVKAPTKEFNGAHVKKKKNPWSFRLNCKLRANKNDPEQESSSETSSLNVGCTSCVCPGYRCPENEPVYKSVLENSDGDGGVAVEPPIANASQLNPDTFPVTDTEDNSRYERATEVSEEVEQPEFLPLLRENSNSLALPITYNSMINLHVLLENSLRLGFGGARTVGILYPPESLMRQIMPVGTETSLLSRTVHTQVDYIHCLVPDLLAITNCGFYWGKMDRYEAERLLENRPEGTFLLRDSAQEEYLFSVSFRRYGRSLHARIEQWNHKFSFDSHDPGVFASHTVCGLIEHYKDPSCCMFFEPLLTNPLARTFPIHLQHLCRATICSRTTYDGICHLELPKSLKNYLKEYHYKQRVRVRHLD